MDPFEELEAGEYVENELLSFLKRVPDPRVPKKTHYPLMEILFMVVCAVISRMDNPNAINRWCHYHREWLKKFIEMKHGVPSVDTFSRVLSILNPVSFGQFFFQWVQTLEGSLGKHIAIDGKTLRRSFDSASGKGAIHLVNVWVSDSQVFLGQKKVDEKSNEITAIPEILDMIALRGRVITIDAMGCQKNIAMKICEKKGDYLLALKKNQGTLYEDVSFFFEESLKEKFKDVDHEYHETVEKGHGRLEIRQYWMVKDVFWLQNLKEWKGLKSLLLVVSTVKKKGKTTQSKRFYISSLKNGVENAAKAIRNHWGIESFHWVLDVVFNEDQCRTRKDFSAENLSLVRKHTVNLLKKVIPKLERPTPLIGVREMASWDPKFLEVILFG